MNIREPAWNGPVVQECGFFQLLPYPRLLKPHYLRKNAFGNRVIRYAKRPKLRGLVQSSFKSANGFISLPINEKTGTVQRSDTKSILNLTRILNLKTTVVRLSCDVQTLQYFFIKEFWRFRSVSHQTQASLILLIMVRHHRYPVLQSFLLRNISLFLKSRAVNVPGIEGFAEKD